MTLLLLLLLAESLPQLWVGRQTRALQAHGIVPRWALSVPDFEVKHRDDRMCVVAKLSPTAPLLRRSTIATVRMALAELPASLADLRRALRKGAVFDSRDAVYDAVRLLGHREEHRVRVSGGKPNYIRFLCSTVPVRGIKEYRRSQPDGGCPFTLSCVQRGCTWVVIASRLNRTCARRSQSSARSSRR